MRENEIRWGHNLGTSECDISECCCTVIPISMLTVHLESEGERMNLPCSISRSNLNLLCKPSEVLPLLVCKIKKRVDAMEYYCFSMASDNFQVAFRHFL